jgi:hypothetical protein
LQVYKSEPTEKLKFSKVRRIPYCSFRSCFDKSTEPAAGSSHMGPSQTYLRFTISWSR